MVLIDSAGAGDIVSMAGLTSPSIGHTVANVEVCFYAFFISFFLFLWVVIQAFVASEQHATFH